jgi:hypothetical protein
VENFGGCATTPALTCVDLVPMMWIGENPTDIWCTVQRLGNCPAAMSTLVSAATAGPRSSR